MAGNEARLYFVITVRGDRGPLHRGEIGELLRSGEIQADDRVRNAFGRQLGQVRDLLAARTPPPMRRQEPAAAGAGNGGRIIGIGVAALLLLAAGLAWSLGGPPPVQPVPRPADPLPVPTPDPAPPPPPRVQSATTPQSLPAGWSIMDIGGAAPAPPVEFRPGGRWWVTGAGDDIWHERDQFRLVGTPLAHDGVVTVQIHGVTGQHVYAKAGVMLRWDRSPSAPFILISLRPGGDGEVLVRYREGAAAEALPCSQHGMPCWLRLRRTGNLVEPLTSDDGQTWHAAASAVELPPTGAAVLAGVAVCSHEQAAMTAICSDAAVESKP